ncbi:DUF3011 domain-containing protein [Thermaurantiacus sp.]
MDIRNLVASVTAGATVLAQVAPVAVILPLAAPAAAQSTRYVEVQCYSAPGRQNRCPLPDGTRSVTYKGPDRSMVCREGRTFRQLGSNLLVSNGCGGIFEAAVEDRGSGWGGSGGSGWGGSGGSGGSGWGGSGGSGWGGSGGEITCRSIDNREQRCRVQTGGRVELLRQLSNAPCIEGQTWRYDRSAIWVRNGCQATFLYGSATGSGGNWGGSGGSWGGSGGSWGGSGGSWGSGFAGEIRCRSSNNRYNRCPVATGGRVELIEKLSRAECRAGRSWGYDSRSIWVNYGCEARFAYGRGSFQPQYGNVGSSSSGGSGSGVAAGMLGAGLAAGLIAILNARGQTADTTRPASTLQADYRLFPAAAQVEAKACMAEAGRQLGHSGATALRLDRVVSSERRGAGWHLVSEVTGTWPKETNRLRLECTATAERVSAFDVRML